MKKHAVLLYAMALAGLVCTFVLLGGRFSAELADKDVYAVMSREHIALLTEAGGTSAEVWAELFGDYHSFAFAAGEKPVALVENHDRTSALLPEGFDLNTYDGPMVKTLYLYEDYANRATATDGQEIENLLFRAVTDRGMRLLILTPFHTADGHLVTDPAVYRDCLSGLAARLQRRGYTFGERFSCMDTAPAEPMLLRGAALLPLSVGLWLVCRLFRTEGRKWMMLLTAACCAALCFAPAKLLMLGAAVAFPCAAAWCAAEYTKRPDHKPLWQTILTGSALLTGWSLLGGLSVSALMSGREYLMGVTIFSGVKLALLLPMAFGCVLLLWALRKNLLGTGLRSWLGLGFAAAAIAGIYLLLTARSGDLSGGISQLETGLRNFLEYTLYARPRTKELLFAVPCVPVFFWACRKKIAPLQLLCGAGLCLECVSVVNTFCHAVAPLLVSVIRSLLSVFFGLAAGLLATAFLSLLFRKKV